MTDEIERGFAAKTLLENHIFRETLDGLDQFYTAAWRNAKTPEAREDCYRYVKLIERLVTDIQSIATTGTIHDARKRELGAQPKKVFRWPTI